MQPPVANLARLLNFKCVKVDRDIKYIIKCKDLDLVPKFVGLNYMYLKT